MLVLSLGRLISPAFAAVILALGLLVAAPANAQTSGSNPTAQAVSEQQLLDELQKIEGRVTLPNTAAGLLQQPQGRDYRGFHEGALPWIGGIAIIGILLLLALFYFFRGRIRTLAGDGEIIAAIYKERVTQRGYGSGAWGWQTAYRETIAV